MKKIFLLLFAPIWLFGAANKLSDVPPASEFYINLEPKECNKKCLADLLKKGQIFSFIARFKDSLADDEMKNKYRDFLAGNFGFVSSSDQSTFAPTNDSQKIAVIIPQKTIKSYAVIVSNALLAYSAATKSKVALQFFVIDSEKDITSALESIANAGFNYVIAPVTDEALPQIADSKYEKIFFYIPTLHANLAKVYRENIVFGGIDYEGQIRALLEQVSGKIASISDGSRLGELLNRQVLAQNPDAYLSVIASKNVDLKAYMSAGIRGANVFLNTTLLKTSLLSSQFRVYDANVKNILCTQICYDPALFSLTQPSDRANMLVAVSFVDADETLLANAKMLGIDLKYDRVAYPVMYGLDYIITNFLDKNAKSYFDESVSSSQVQYKTYILQATKTGFSVIKE